MSQKAIHATRGFNFTGLGVQATPIESAAAKIESNFDELFRDTTTVPLTPNGTGRGDIVLRGDRTLSGFQVRLVGAAFETGTFTLFVEDEAGNTLMNVASINATLFGASYGPVTLTATLAHRAIVRGKLIRCRLVSNNGSATGGFLVIEASYVKA